MKETASEKFKEIYKEEYYYKLHRVGSEKDPTDEEEGFSDFKNVYCKPSSYWESEIKPYVSGSRVKFKSNIYNGGRRTRNNILCWRKWLATLLASQRLQFLSSAFFFQSSNHTNRRTILNDDTFNALMNINSWSHSDLKKDICMC